MPTLLGLTFQPRSDVDPVAKDIVPLDDDIAEIDSDPELDWSCGRQVTLAHCALNSHRTFDSVDDASEFHKRPVPHLLKIRPGREATAGLKVSFQICRNVATVAGFVGLHHAAVAGNVGSEDRGKAPGDPGGRLFGHAASKGRARKITVSGNRRADKRLR